MQMKECELLEVHVAPFREAHGDGGLADEPFGGEVFAGRGHSLHAEVAREVPFDLGGRPRLAHVAQIVEERREQPGRALGNVLVRGVERGLHRLLRLLLVEKVGIDRVEEAWVECHRLRQDLAVGEKAVADHLDPRQ